ncbi:hypothetical protein ACI2KT_27570 [Ensifer adhaerens]
MPDVAAKTCPEMKTRGTEAIAISLIALGMVRRINIGSKSSGSSTVRERR